MPIKIYFLGKTNPKEYEQLETLYTKRISHLVPFRVEVLNSPYKNLPSIIEKNPVFTILDDKGKVYDTPGLHKWLGARLQTGARDTVFFIGDAYGLPAKLLEKASFKLSLTPLTLPHALARVLFLEQLYRVISMEKGMPYHH